MYKEKYHEEAPKMPKTAEDYHDYGDIFPDEKTNAKHKHDQVLERECDVAKALMNKKSNEKVILHFDSTTRNRTDGDWPSLILNIHPPLKVSNKFTLQPLFFAFEYRQNISKLIVENLYRLSVTVGTRPRLIWELIDRFMTDSVTKNQQVEHLVA